MRRTLMLPIRVSPAEKALIEENAKASGLDASSFLRQLGTTGTTRKPLPKKATKRSPDRSPSFEQRVRQMARLMPKSNAERQVRREEAKEQAKAALGS